MFNTKNSTLNYIPRAKTTWIKIEAYYIDLEFALCYMIKDL